MAWTSAAEGGPSRRRSGLWLAALCALLAAAPAQAKPPRQGWDKKWGPLVPHTKFPKDCGLCHVAKRWDVIRKDFVFDHKKETEYALEGAHAQALCLRCHNDRGDVRSFAARGCAGCHRDPHKKTLGADCTRCHDQNTWRPVAQFLEHAQTRFPLTGVHQAVSCQACHPREAQGDFKGNRTDCYSCHQADYRRAPHHAAMNYPRDCQNCHNTSAWHGGGAGGAFNHAALPSGGAGMCSSCHQADYRRAPDHAARNYPQSCDSCHNTASWAGARFNHNALPGGGTNCVLCHQADYQRAPDHAARNYPQTCANCHNTTSWLGGGGGGTFNHQSLPGGGSGMCSSCHQADYRRAPDHAARNYPQSCDSCHNTASWAGVSFNHAALPGGAADCHGCHQSDYLRGPGHAAKSYPRTCGDCHGMTSWTGAVFNHRFPLRSNHDVACNVCHDTGSTRSFTCLVCHKHSQQLMDEKHRGRAGYTYSSQACYNCHPNGTH